MPVLTHCERFGNTAFGVQYLSAVGHEAVNQRVAVVEQSVELLGGLHGNWGVRVELLPLH